LRWSTQKFGDPSAHYLRKSGLPETKQAGMKLDAAGAFLATVGWIAVVFGFSMVPQKGWTSATTIVLGVVALAAFAAFAMVVGPVQSMSPAQLHALDSGYTYGMLWLAGVCVLACGITLFIGYSAQQVALAQEVKQAVDAE
jgi:hypothetical protein